LHDVGLSIYLSVVYIVFVCHSTALVNKRVHNSNQNYILGVHSIYNILQALKKHWRTWKTVQRRNRSKCFFLEITWYA